MAGIYERDQNLKVADIGDTIFTAQSDKVPFGKLLKRGPKPKGMLTEWPAQVYPARPFGGTLDGTDMVTFEHTNRDKISAYGMWLRTKGWMVSRLANLTQTHGVKGKEEAKQAADDSLILGQMMEKQLLSDSDTQAESGATPYRSRGVFSWLSAIAQGVLPVPAAYRPAAACVYTSALASFAPASMEAMLEAAAGQKLEKVDLTGFVGIKLKTRMSTWAQRVAEGADTAQALQRYNMDAKDKKILRVVDFFDFDAGSVRLFTHWYLLHDEETGLPTDYTPRSGAFLDLARNWELRYLDPPAAYIEPPKSGGPRGYHDAVYTLVCHMPAGQCMVKTAA
jgi:hypothetical protein